QLACFLGGFLVVGIALVSPLEPLSERLFAAHMTQHLLLATIAPPLLVLGAPTADAVRDARPGLSPWLEALFDRIGFRRVWHLLSLPIVAWCLHTSAMWAWHAPSLYERSLRNDVLHVLQHLSLAGTGVLLWWGILRPRRPGLDARRTAF